MRKTTLPILSNFIFVVLFTASLFSVSVKAQQNELLLGHWELKKITYKKIEDSINKDKDNLRILFKNALLNTLDKEQQLIVEEVDLINIQAEELATINYQSRIEFQSIGAFYNTSKKPLSGEYLLDGKKLLLQWETAEENNFKILKITEKELVLKDNQLKTSFYYNKLEQKQVDEQVAKLKKEKELGCTKPDPDRVAAEKAAKEKLKQASKTE